MRCTAFFALWLIALLVPNALLAQLSGDTLRGVEVTAQPPRGTVAIKSGFEAGAKKLGVDSITRQAYEQQSVANLLQNAVAVFVKSYGFNAASTLSFRGASAAQSAVYWEGIPLMSGASGLTDVSTLPVSMFDSLSLDYGSNAALWGSGNVGGALMLGERNPSFSAGLQANARLALGIGSFSQRTAAAAFNLSTRNISISARGQLLQAQNDFLATDERGRRYRLDNAAQSEAGAMISGAWHSGPHSILQARYWLQAYDRQIPPALFETHSYKAQRDAAHRVLAEWQHDGIHSRSYVKAALLIDSFRYTDSAIGLQFASRTQQFFAEGGWAGRVGKGGKLLFFAPVQYFALQSGSASPEQLRVAIGTAFSQSFFTGKLLVAANFRLEAFDGKLIPLPGINGTYHLSSDFSIRANAQYTYRAPTLNELYYNPGGNRDLRPERGWSIDGGYDLKAPVHRANFTHSLSLYNRNITDWIIWLGGSVWTPHNLASVHSRGIETENALAGKWHRISWMIAASASYTRSSPTQSYLTGDGSIGRQLPYVPEWLAQGEVRIGYRAFMLSCDAHFNGRRYIVSDETEWLEPYLLGNLRAGWSCDAGAARINIQCAINNIGNLHYEVVGYRPMPGINYVLSASVNLKK